MLYSATPKVRTIALLPRSSQHFLPVTSLPHMRENSADCCSTVNTINGARPFKEPAHILTIPAVVQILNQRSPAQILELGAGCLRNALHLQKAGHSVSILEVKGIEKRFPIQYALFRAAGGSIHYSFPLSHRFDLVLCTFVIESICNPHQRTHLLALSAASLKAQGLLLISVRGPGDLVTARNAGIRCSDGYLTPGYTFARSYNLRQLRSLLLSSGYRTVWPLHKPTTKRPEYLHVIASKE
jgi:hypothetical protein